MQYQSVLAFVLLCCSGLSCRAVEQDSSLAGIPFTYGTLLVDPDADPGITGGIVQFRIYKTGDIFYSGEVSYYTGDVLKEVQVPFNGRYKVKPEDVLSQAYRAEGAERLVNKATLKVVGVADRIAAVSGFVSNPKGSDSSDAFGVMKLDLAEAVVSIVDMEVTGSIYEGTPLETSITVHLHKP